MCVHVLACRSPIAVASTKNLTGSWEFMKPIITSVCVCVSLILRSLLLFWNTSAVLYSLLFITSDDPVENWSMYFEPTTDTWFGFTNMILRCVVCLLLK